MEKASIIDKQEQDDRKTLTAAKVLIYGNLMVDEKMEDMTRLFSINDTGMSVWLRNNYRAG